MHSHRFHKQSKPDQVGQKTAVDFFLTPLDPSSASPLPYLAAD